MNLHKYFLDEWKSLEAKVLEGASVVVAVSGGLDSMVLLHLIKKVIPLNRIVVAHFDHQVRASSQDVALWVEGYCRQMGIEKVILGKRKGKGISEEALRKERYQFLETTRKQSGSKYILLAHHANDQFETLLMRLIRGTGVHGLASMAPKAKVLLRPLLAVSKSDLMEFVAKEQIPFREDETNQSGVYFRNQIRHELIPVFAKLSVRFGGEEKLLKRIGALTEEIHGLRKECRKRALKWLGSHLIETPFWNSFSRQNWLALTTQEKKSVALQLWKKLANEPLETKELKLLGEAIRNKKTVVLSGGVQVITSCGIVYCLTPLNQKRLTQARTGKQAWDFCCRKGKKRELQALLKTNQAELRFLRPGDRFKNKKMKRRCLSEGLPSPERALLPVVAKKGSNELLWYFPLTETYLDYVEAPWSVKTQ